MKLHNKCTFFININTSLFSGEQLQKNVSIGDEDAIANKALKSCLKILDKEKYPQIAASSYYLLSDIYIPDDTNPLCPKFASGQDSPEPQRYSKKLIFTARSNENRTFTW